LRLSLLRPSPLRPSPVPPGAPQAAATHTSTVASRGQVVALFLSFAFAYFLSALLRAVTATLAPVFSTELQLSAGDLGLLAGAYFFGFALMQLPLGHALDRYGPRRTLLCLLLLAVLGCVGFAVAPSMAYLVAARVLIGAGVSACLMAPLTCYRSVLSPVAQLRANAWMLMAGSLGMVASTLPVQWLLPLLGWRGLFWAAAVGLAVAMLWLAWQVPKDPAPAKPGPGLAGGHPAPLDANSAGPSGYALIARDAQFVSLVPLGFFLYGGLVAIQSLWAGPWLTRVSGWSATQAAQGLFVINLCMLAAFFTWGLVMPRLARRGITATRLMLWGLPLPLLLLALNLWLGAQATALHWAAWCVACTFVSVSQPALGAAFAAHLAGRALSAFNLVIFSGVFCVQWGLGLAIDALQQQGWPASAAFQGAFAAYGVCCGLAYAWFVWCQHTRAVAAGAAGAKPAEEAANNPASSAPPSA
jgi:MFS family permease